MEVKISKVIVKGKSVIASDTGRRVEIKNPEILVIERKPKETK